jgi:hypothetical protein
MLLMYDCARDLYPISNSSGIWDSSVAFVGTGLGVTLSAFRAYGEIHSGVVGVTVRRIGI